LEDWRGALKNSDKNWLVTAVLCAFLGWFGVHRFYVGKILTGILYLLTGGIFGIGVIVDALLLLTDNFRDAQGRVVAIESSFGSKSG
jgi:TM2 domain-containing membrane protein YozV